MPFLLISILFFFSFSRKCTQKKEKKQKKCSQDIDFAFVISNDANKSFNLFTVYRYLFKTIGTFELLPVCVDTKVLVEI